MNIEYVVLNVYTHRWADNIGMDLRMCGFIWFRTGSNVGFL
jgi:hypothetical protein